MHTRTFTPEQQAVAHHRDGHALVSAVAGSGKTTTLVEHIAALVDAGVPDARILCLQFGKANQLDFEQKLERRVPGMQVRVRTYHALARAFLEHFVRAGEIGRAEIETSAGFWEARARDALQGVWRKAFADQPRPGSDVFAEFLKFIGLAKSTLATPEQTFAASGIKPELKVFVDAFRAFEKARHDEIARGAGKRSFDDMLYDLLKLLRTRPELWRQLQGRLDRIIVDEFQDTNPIQFDFLRGLAGDSAIVMACGDPDQSIYRFRGSQVAIMTRQFEAAFSPCTRYTLTRTFRYGPRVALLANHLIARNRERDDKIVVSAPSCPDTSVERIPVRDGQPSGLVPLLASLATQHRLHEVLMLVRNFDQALPFEFELAKAGIPYAVEGRESLLKIPELTALTGVLHLAAGGLPREPAAAAATVDALLSVPTLYIDRATLAPIQQDLIAAAMTGRRLGDVFNPHIARLPTRAQESIARRAAAISDIESGRYLGHRPAEVLRRYINATDMLTTIERAASTPERAQMQIGNIRGLLNLAGQYAESAPLIDAIHDVAARTRPHGDYLRITSIHRAKGAEAPMVIVAGFNAAFPSPNANLQEERRLAYVAITRAQERLVLIHPHDIELESQVRKSAQGEHSVLGSASRFLYEMDFAGAESVHRALFAGGLGARCERPDLAERYAQEIGRKVGFTHSGPEPAPKVAPIEFPPANAFKPLTERMAVQVGDYLQAIGSARRGVVVKVPKDRVAVLRDVSGGEVGIALTRGLWLHAPKG